MVAPKKYEHRTSFTFNVEERNLEGIKEIAYREHIPAGEKINNLMASEVEKVKVLQQPQTNSIGVTFLNGQQLKQVQHQQQDAETNRRLIINRLINAVNEAIPIITEMDNDEFASKITTHVIKKIYESRGPKYKGPKYSDKNSSQRKDLVSNA